MKSSIFLESNIEPSFHVCLMSAFYRRKCLPINLLNCNECQRQNGNVFICWHKFLANEMSLHVSKNTTNANPCINLNQCCVIISFEIYFYCKNLWMNNCLLHIWWTWYIWPTCVSSINVSLSWTPNCWRYQTIWGWSQLYTLVYVSKCLVA